MNQKSYDESKLKQFYRNRTKFNQEARDILGVDLHDLSKESNSDYLNNDSLKTNRKFNEKILDDFFSQIDQTSKGQRLYKENIDLKNKILRLGEENKVWKYKASLWDQIKQYITSDFHHRSSIQGINVATNDARILEEFIKNINKLIDEISDSKILSAEKRTLQDQISLVKQQTNAQKIAKIMIENERLSIQNQLMKTKIQSMNHERKARFNLMQVSIQEQFQKLKNNNESKKQQKNDLSMTLKAYQTEIKELKKKLAAQIKRNMHEKKQNKEQLQVQFFKNINHAKQKQISSLKTENSIINAEKQDLLAINDKMKKMVIYAAQMNNQFMKKLQKSLQNKKLTPNQEYFNTKTGSPQRPNLLQNKRFKILKSQSVDKTKNNLQKIYNK